LPMATSPQPKPIESLASGSKPEVVRVTETPTITPASSNATFSHAAPPTNPSVGNPTNRLANQASAKPEKKGFFQKLNPISLFHHDGTKDNAPKAQSNDLAPSETLLQPRVAEAQPEVTHRAAAQPVREISMARYPYLSPGAPVAGNRSEAERLLASGIAAQRNQRLADAVAFYRSATLTDPSCFEAQTSLGLAAFDAGDLPTALRADELALAIKPDSFATRYNFGLALKKANYIRDAAQELENLLASNPPESPEHLAVVHLTLANLYSEQFHQNGRARQHYLKVLELDPQNSQATSIRYWLRDNP